MKFQHLFICILHLYSIKAYSYKENLFIQPLQDGQVFIEFKFTQSMEYQSSAKHLSWGNFPRDIGDLAREFDIEQLSLTLTQGRWLEDKWKIFEPEISATVSSSAGAELVTIFKDGPGETLDNLWKRLTHSLSGLFCASLLYIDSSVSAIPRWTFNTNSHATNIRYGKLPHETTCTENLTPWIKLLPCQNNAGLSTFLNAYKLYDSSFHSMRINVDQECKDGKCTIDLIQRVLLVMDPFRLLNSNDWSLNSLLDHQLKQLCHLSEHTLAQFDRPLNLPMELTSSSDFSTFRSKNVETSLFETLGEGFDFIVSNATNNVVVSGNKVFIDRYLTGYGHEFGGLHVQIRNQDKTKIELIYFDTLPWFMMIYLNTISININDKPQKPSQISDFYYQPAIARQRPTVLEFKISVPANSKLSIEFKYEKAMLRYTEYPPGAERGFDLGGAVISTEKRRIYTPNLLLPQPTPDFSMPYNVITLTCSVLALFFGTVYNSLVRSLKSEDAEPSGLRGILFRLAKKARRMLRRKEVKKK